MCAEAMRAVRCARRVARIRLSRAALGLRQSSRAACARHRGPDRRADRRSGRCLSPRHSDAEHRASRATLPLWASARGHKTDTSETTRATPRDAPPASGSAPICRRNCVASDRACTRVTRQNLHGKEGVDGSSPSEGFAQKPCKSACCVARSGEISIVRGYEDGYISGLAGIRGHARRLATRRGVCSTESIADYNSKSSCKLTPPVAWVGAKVTTSFAREGVGACLPGTRPKPFEERDSEPSAKSRCAAYGNRSWCPGLSPFSTEQQRAPRKSKEERPATHPSVACRFRRGLSRPSASPRPQRSPCRAKMPMRSPSSFGSTVAEPTRLG